MKRALVPLLLAGCATSYEGVTPWREDVLSGLAVRAVGQGPYSQGGPVLVRVEARNNGPRAVVVDVQGLAHEPYSVEPAAYVNSRMFGTSQHFETFKPGETRKLAEVDLACLFALLEPGDYVFRFHGLRRWGLSGEPPEGPPGALLGEVPEAPPLRIRLAPGPRTRRDEVLARLLPRVPPDWSLPYASEAEGQIRLTYRRRLPDGHLEIEASCGAKDERRRLGMSMWGEVRLGAPRVMAKRERRPADDVAEAEAARDVVPLLERTLREALEISP